MAYKCRECGEIFDEPKRVEEPRGEFWGVPCSETCYYCPCCESSDFDEASIVEAEEQEELDEYERWEDER